MPEATACMCCSEIAAGWPPGSLAGRCPVELAAVAFVQCVWLVTREATLRIASPSYCWLLCTRRRNARLVPQDVRTARLTIDVISCVQASWGHLSARWLLSVANEVTCSCTPFQNICYLLSRLESMTNTCRFGMMGRQLFGTTSVAAPRANHF